MYIENKEEYREIPISVLNLSTRSFNCLMRANISTLYLLIENVEKLKEILNMGSEGIAEIEKILHKILENEKYWVENAISKGIDSGLFIEKRPSLSKEILCRPASDLNVSVRICNCFKKENIETIGQVLALNDVDVLHLKNMGLSPSSNF
ncbi:MAG: hypothetical protein HFI68_06125 [Lachnospiraceae bacterium]|nr:hypothetical protein [Lachnospiraceae bacterium]